MAEKLKYIYNNTQLKNLRWQYAVDDDILSDEIRQLKFVNWINKLVIPTAGRNSQWSKKGEK